MAFGFLSPILPVQEMLTTPHAEAAELPQPREWTPDALESLAREKADKYGVSQETFVRVMKCESMNFEHNGQSFIEANGPNGREDSWGVVQIHLPSHKVTKEQALDPEWALEWAAKQFSEGNASMWSCY